jgi:hypothetical protein
MVVVKWIHNATDFAQPKAMHELLQPPSIILSAELMAYASLWDTLDPLPNGV